jgi:hypothetical protein
LPAQFERLRADPKLARNAFEEALRFTSPLHTFCRTAAVTTTVAGVEIEEGTKSCACSARPISGAQHHAGGRCGVAAQLRDPRAGQAAAEVSVSGER